MAVPERIYGKDILIKFGDPGVDYPSDTTNVFLDNEEAANDVVTYADAKAGGKRQHFFQLTALQSTSTGSFWRYAWENTGEEVDFVYAPHGNPTPTPDKPHFKGTVKIGPKPKIGDAANTTATFETRWDLVGDPVMDTGESSSEESSSE